MSQHTISPEITFAPDHSGGTKRIWKTFYLLSILTIFELAIGLTIYNIHRKNQIFFSLIQFVLCKGELR